jgi:hypothetical protein
MHISATKAAVATPPSSPGKSAVVPPGLARRDLDRPPGITKKMEDGGVAPAGVARRFPAAAPPPDAPVQSSSEAGVPPADAATNGTVTPVVDLLV